MRVEFNSHFLNFFNFCFRKTTKRVATLPQFNYDVTIDATTILLIVPPPRVPRLRRLPPRPPLRHVHVGPHRQAQQVKVQVGEIP